MDAATILSFVVTAVETLIKVEPVIVKTVSDLKPYAQALYQKLVGGRDLNDEERATISAGIDALYARLEEPLPPAQPGDPDYVAPTG